MRNHGALVREAGGAVRFDAPRERLEAGVELCPNRYVQVSTPWVAVEVNRPPAYRWYTLSARRVNAGIGVHRAGVQRLVSVAEAVTAVKLDGFTVGPAFAAATACTSMRIPARPSRRERSRFRSTWSGAPLR